MVSEEGGVKLNLNSRDPTKNILTVGLEGIRRLHVFLVAPRDKRVESHAWWYLSAWATLRYPLAVFGLDSLCDINLAPSQLPIPPLGSGLMHVATVFWPGVPAAASLSVSFASTGDQADGKTIALAFPDITPHDYVGLLRGPIGHPTHPARLLAPLPDDPEVLEKLFLSDRLPPQRLPPKKGKRV